MPRRHGGRLRLHRRARSRLARPARAARPAGRCPRRTRPAAPLSSRPAASGYAEGWHPPGASLISAWTYPNPSSSAAWIRCCQTSATSATCASDSSPRRSERAPACESRPPGARTPGRGSARREPARDLRSGTSPAASGLPGRRRRGSDRPPRRSLGRRREPRAWTTTAARRDDHPATRQEGLRGSRSAAGVAALEVEQRLTRSIGSGRISVDERSELISSIVCR